MNNDAIICSGSELESVLAGIREKGCVITDLTTGVGGNAGYRVNYFDRVEESRDSQCTVLPCPVATPVAMTKQECGVKSPAAITKSDGEEGSTPSGHASATAAGSAPSKRAPVPVVAGEHAVSSISNNSESVVQTAPSIGRRSAGEMCDGDDGGTRPALNQFPVPLLAGSVGVAEPRHSEAGESKKTSDKLTQPRGVTLPAGIQFPHQCKTPAIPAAPEAVKSAVAPRNPLYDPESLVKGQPHSQGDGAETVGVVPSEIPLPHCPTCSGTVTQGMACPICAGLERVKAGVRRLRNRFKTSNREARLPHAND